MSDESPTPEDQETTETLRDSTSRSRRIGNYRLLQKLGEGGMGEVWEAEQEKPVRRRVALKLIKWGMDTKSVIARFEAERQALALMNHPNVAKIFDAGATEQGRPYFVMELVKGLAITEHCDRQRLTTNKRLELFMQACEGAQHAHQKGIIHRDIKPTNILIAREGDNAVPKIIDFGVAKATAQRLTEKTVFTELGQLIGTPEYMSPEQADLTNDDIDTRTDVYSLGALLYELLVGVRPFDARQLRSAGFDELRRIIREVEPSRPSTRVTSLGAVSEECARRRGTRTRDLVSNLRGDLDWITMRALEKDRTRRYGTVADLAADVGRYLRDEAIAAGPPGVAYRLRKFAKRHRAPLLFLSVVLLAGVAGLAITLSLYARSERARQAEFTARLEAQRERATAQRQAYAASLLAAELARQANLTRTARQHLESAPIEHRDWEWRWLRGRIDLSVRTLIADEAREVAAWPGGLAVVTSKELLILNPATLEVRSRFDLAGGSAVAVSLDGRLLATGTCDGMITLRDLVSNRELRSWTADESGVDSIVFGPDASRIASAPSATGCMWMHYCSEFCEHDFVGVIKIWDVRSGMMERSIEAFCDGVNALEFSPDGAHLVAVADAPSPGAVPNYKIWDVRDGRLIRQHAPLTSALENVAYDPTGRFIASVGFRSVVQIRDSGTGNVVRELAGHDSAVHVVAFHPTRAIVATAGDDKTIRVWDVESGDEIETLVGHESFVEDLRFNADGTALYSVALESVRLWSFPSRPAEVTFDGHRHRSIDAVDFHPSGELAVSASWYGDVLVWDSSTGTVETSFRPDCDGDFCPINALAYSPDGSEIAIAANDCLIVWDPRTDQHRELDRHEYSVQDVVFLPEGRRIAAGWIDSATQAGMFRLYDAETGEILESVEEGRVYVVDASREMGLVAALDTRESLVRILLPEDVWTTIDLKEIGCDAQDALALSPDGGSVAVGCLAGRIHEWDLASGARLDYAGHDEQVSSLTYSPNGKRLLSGGDEKTVRIWSTEDGRGLLTLRGPTGPVQEVAVSDDGSRVAAAAWDGVVRVWRAPEELP